MRVERVETGGERLSAATTTTGFPRPRECTSRSALARSMTTRRAAQKTFLEENRLEVYWSDGHAFGANRRDPPEEWVGPREDVNRVGTQARPGLQRHPRQVAFSRVRVIAVMHVVSLA